MELLTRADNGIFAVGTFCRLEITDLARAILTAFSSLDDIEPLEFFVVPAALLARRFKGSFGTKDIVVAAGAEDDSVAASAAPGGPAEEEDGIS